MVGPGARGGAVVTSHSESPAESSGWKTCKKFASFFPYFAYVLIFYVIIALAVSDVRAILFIAGSYELTWVEVLYLVAAWAAMGELHRVTHPGVDNTREALTMGGVLAVYLVFFVLGSAGISGFRIFNNTEFLMMMLILAGQVVLAFIINSATLKRSIGHDVAP